MTARRPVALLCALSLALSLATPATSAGASDRSSAHRSTDADSALGGTAFPAATGAAPYRHRVTVVRVQGEYDQLGAGEVDLAVGAGVDGWPSDVPAGFRSMSRRATVTYAASGEACGLASRAAFDTLTAKIWRAVRPPAVAGTADHLVVVVPPGCADGALAGRSTRGRAFSSGGALVVAATGTTAGLAAEVRHQFGHHLGLGHSDVASCLPGDDDPTESCVVTDHADCYSPMGDGGLASLSSAHRLMRGVTEAGELTTLTAAATRTIRPRGSGSGVRGLRVTDPRTGDVYVVDYRDGEGLDAGAAYVVEGKPSCRPGVVITRLATKGTVQLLSTYASGEPEPSISFGAGDTVDVVSGGVTFHVDSVGAATSVAVTPHPGAAFASVPRPRLTGQAIVGSVLRATSAAASPHPDRTEVRWYVGGVLAVDAYGDPVLGRAFRLRPGDRGRRVVAEVAAYLSGHRRTTARSTAYGPVLAPLVAGSTKVTGAAKVGRRLTVRPTGWTAGTTFRYQWLAGGRVVAGATKASFKLTRQQLGQRLSVRVTGRKASYTTVVRTSRRTARVKA